MANCVITGSSGDIGIQVVKDMLESGHNVAAVYYEDNHELPELIALSEQGDYGKISSFKTDLRTPRNCQKLINDVNSSFGGIDILINGIGIISDRKLHNKTTDEIINIIDTNLLAPIYVTKYCLPQIKNAENGRIINISSIIGMNGNTGQAIYSSAKAGLVGFTKSIASEIKGSGSTANILTPGFVDSRMVKQIPEDFRNRIKNEINHDYFIPTQSISDVISFLVEPKSRYINGSEILVDDGFMSGTI